MSKSGFTILEVLLAIVLVAILAGITVPIYQFFQVRSDLDISVNMTAQSLRRAQVLAQAVDGDISWGVKIQSGSIVIFKGASYAARDSNYDESYNLNTDVTPSGNTEIIFTKFTGLPSVIGSSTLTSSNGETRTITINSKGAVDF